MPVGTSKTIASAWFKDDHFGESRVAFEPEDLKNAQMLVLWGGEDISPSIYNEVPVYAHAGPTPSKRDAGEMNLVKEAVRLGIPILGVCRGAQLLCAMHGGGLWQHVWNHAGRNHTVKVTTKLHTIIGLSNSAHHQMMRPDKEAEILGQIETPLSLHKCGQDIHFPVKTEDPEPEIVWFPKFRALGVQGHPEWLDKSEFLNQITHQLFKEKTNVSLFGR